MRYQAVDFINQYMEIVASGIGTVNKLVNSDANPIKNTSVGRCHNAILETSSRLLRNYPKNDWNYPDVKVKSKYYPVIESIEVVKPFCKLTKFRREGLSKNAPKVLFVAALSGHHATLSRETFEEFLVDHEIYVTDWADARYVPVEDGRFGFEEYIEYVIDFLEHIGPGTHLFGLCQGGVPALAAAAIMARKNNPAKPQTMLFMASPMDIRVNPNLLIKLAKHINLSILSLATLHRVPKRFPGRGRLVYPGAMQLSGFMGMNLKSHVKSHTQFFRDVYKGDLNAADKHRNFYNEYFSILDGTAEFYLETIERVFLDQQLPKGTMTFKGEQVDCSAITDIPLFTIEGAQDDMVMIGQCQAAHDMCSNLPKELQDTLVQEGVGHYGIFNGSIYREQVAPRAKQFISKYN